MYPAAAGIVGVLYPAGRPRTLAFVGITCGGAAGAAGGQLLAGAFLEYLQYVNLPSELTQMDVARLLSISRSHVPLPPRDKLLSRPRRSAAGDAEDPPPGRLTRCRPPRFQSVPGSLDVDDRSDVPSGLEGSL